MPRYAAPAAFLLAVLALTGCGLGANPGTTSPSAPLVTHFNGSVHGGQQPVGGSTIQMYEVITSGYFTAAHPILTQSVVTDANGSFNITENYTCTAANQVYMTATGGNPGLGAGTNNTALALMATIGSCSFLLQNRASINLNVNEVTTVAAAWSLSRFMSSPTIAGTSSSNAAGLASAFANSGNVANIASGNLPGLTLPAGATLPTSEIYTLADILSTCVNSDGNLTQGSACQKLFAAATPPGGTAPADTITAALDIASNPTSNVSTLYNLSSATAPFQPTLGQAPNNWLVGIRFIGGGLAQPAALAIDAGGSVWTANPANNSVSRFSASGAPASPAAGFTDPSLSAPGAIALDSSGNAWFANTTGSTVTGITSSGNLVGTLSTNLSYPNSIAFDGAGNSWVASPGTGTLVEFNPNQTFLQQLPLNAAPTSIAINPY
jgi:streptogramin lyase